MSAEDNDPYRPPEAVPEPRRLSWLAILCILAVAVLAGVFCFFSTCLASAILLDRLNIRATGVVIGASVVGALVGAVVVARWLSGIRR